MIEVNTVEPRDAVLCCGNRILQTRGESLLVPALQQAPLESSPSAYSGPRSTVDQGVAVVFELCR